MNKSQRSLMVIAILIICLAIIGCAYYAYSNHKAPYQEVPQKTFPSHESTEVINENEAGVEKATSTALQTEASTTKTSEILPSPPHFEITSLKPIEAYIDQSVIVHGRQLYGKDLNGNLSKINFYLNGGLRASMLSFFQSYDGTQGQFTISPSFFHDSLLSQFGDYQISVVKPECKNDICNSIESNRLSLRLLPQEKAIEYSFNSIIYNNALYRFQFQYPSSFVMYGGSSEKSIALTNSLACAEYAGTENAGEYHIGCLYVSVYTSDATTLDTTGEVEKDQFKIDGIRGVKITDLGLNSYNLIGQVQHNHRWYIIGVTSNIGNKESNIKLFDQLISRFKFTN